MGKKNLTINPMGATAPVNAGADSWYSIQASANNSADISIYDEIGGWGISARQFAEELTALGNISSINLHIHSPGGSVFDGIAIYNLLKNHPASKTVYIDGLAASMASVIAMVGNPIIMPENAMMMIHFHSQWFMQRHDKVSCEVNVLFIKTINKNLNAWFFIGSHHLPVNVYCNVYCKRGVYGWRQQIIRQGA